MSAPRSSLLSFHVIGFDCMGTLLDERRGIDVASHDVRQKLPDRVTPQQFYEVFETHLAQRLDQASPPTSYREIMEISFAETVESLSNRKYHATSEECSNFAQALARWPAWNDTVASLQFLGQKHKLVALSNMDTSTLEDLVKNGAFQGIPFSVLQGGDKTGAFKPDHRVNQALLDIAKDSFGASKEQVLLVAQGYKSDHVPANEMGISSAWINRYGADENIAKDAQPTWTYASLQDLVDEMKIEQQKQE